MEFYKKRYQNKKLAILGFGVEGKSTAQFLLKLGFNFDIIDQDTDAVYKWQQQYDGNCQIYNFDQLTSFDFDQYDLIFRTPGFSKTKLNLINQAKLTSQANEFLLTQSQKTIGISGTKGKSTTCSLLAYLLQKLNQKVALIGNIG